jgi:hypothetical protein
MDNTKPTTIKLKDYIIKTQIEIGEVRHHFKKGNFHNNPFAFYYFVMRNSSGMTQVGSIKNRKELFKKLSEEFR